MIVKNVFIAWFWLRFNEILRCDTVNTSTVFLLELYNAYTCNRRWFNFLKYGRWGYADYTYIKLFGFYIIAGFSKVGSNSVIKALGYLFFFFVSCAKYPQIAIQVWNSWYVKQLIFVSRHFHSMHLLKLSVEIDEVWRMLWGSKLHWLCPILKKFTAKHLLLNH